MELAPVIVAVGSLVFFTLYYLYVATRGIPQHWGVPYKDRLRRCLHNSAHGVALEIFNAVFSIASCVLFVMETYDFSLNYNFIVKSFSLELGFNGFFLCNFVLQLYLASHKLWHLVSLQAVVDIVTVPPSYAILIMNDGLRNSRGGLASAYLGLKVTRVIRVVRLLGAISFFGGGPSLAFDRSRQVLVLQSQLMRRGLQTLVVIFIMAGLTNFLVEVQNADWGTGYGRMPFHDALYYIVVSFSTVGYGDISPSTPLSRLLISGLILSLFFCAPLVTNALVNLTRMTPKHGGSLSKRMGMGHIVIGCDSSCLRVVSVLLSELLAPDSTAYHTAHIVIVVPQEPTLAWEALLCLQPSRAVTYLNGDLRSAKDLRRARVGDARACFVLADRLATDSGAQDKTALVRALCVHQASPPGASVLCLVTHGESKRRLVRLGVPVTSVVCYHDVMEGLVAHACLHPGFSTIWANILSCMPEAGQLLKAKGAEQATLTDDRATLVYETEMEYLRSLQGVLIRFHLNAFSGECVGDMAIELHREVGCTLIALIGAACSDVDDEGGGMAGRGIRDKFSARVHPDYGSIVRDNDIGVFIGANRLTADCLARYCAARLASAMAPEDRMPPSLLEKTLSFTRSHHAVDGRIAGGECKPGKGESGKKGEEEERRKQVVLRSIPQTVKPGKTQHGNNTGERRRSFSKSSLPDMMAERQRGGTGVSITSPWSEAHEDGWFTPALVSPLYVEGLSGSPPGRIVVVAQTLSFALGVVLFLCEASSGRGGEADSASTVTVLCPPAFWDPTADEAAERALAAQFPSVRVHKSVPESQSLLDCEADSADLVCIVSSRGSEKHVSESYDQSPSEDDGGDSGWGHGSDGWAMGVVVDVLGLVTSSTRVVVRFDETGSAEQHQVINAHVRQRCAAQEERDRLGRLEEGGKRYGQEEKVEEQGTAPGTAAPKESARCKKSAINESRSNEGGKGRHADAPEVDAHYSGRGKEAAYFDGTGGVRESVFEGCFATMSGYASGDVVVGNAAELLLLQTMMSEDVQFILSNVLKLTCRVPVKTLWPRRLPETYGEAYRSLLKDRNLLAVGLHRPPIPDRDNLGDANSDGQAGNPPHETRRRARSAAVPGNPLHETRRRTCSGAVPDKGQYPGHNSSATNLGDGASARSAEEGQGRYLSGSRFLAIACPRASFPLRAGDCLFVCRRPSELAATAAEWAAPLVDVASRCTESVSSNGGALHGDSGTISTLNAYRNEAGDGMSPLTENAAADQRFAEGVAVDGDTQGKRQAAARQADDDSTAVAAWAIGLLVRSSPHRVNRYDHNRADRSSDNDQQPLLRVRVIDAIKRAAADNAGGEGGNIANQKPSSAPMGEGRKHGSCTGNGRGRAPPPSNFECAGCGRTLRGWEEGGDNDVPLALGCGHTVCLKCLEALDEEGRIVAEDRESSELVSASWVCPLCGESASAVLPLV